MHARFSTTLHKRPVEVVHFVSTFAVKTDTKWLLELARYLDPSEFRLTFCCFYEGGPIQYELAALGVHTHNLDVPGERDLRAIVRARDLMESCEAQIVHTHLLRADLMAGLAARWAAVPIHVSTSYAMAAYQREKRRRSDRLLDAVCSALPTHTIAVSQAVASDCIARLRRRPEDVTVIHTGIDPPDQFFDAGAAALRQALHIGDRPMVVTVARLSYEKGVEVLIDAAAQVHRSRPEVGFVVLGEGPDRPALEAQIERLGLGGVVRLVGFNPDVWPALRAADVVCLPSRSEGMPNVLLEAMAMARPIVATQVGGIPEAIIDGENGRLVPPGDPDALCAAIVRTLDDRPTALRMGQLARRTVQDRFNARSVAARYADLYRRLLLQRRPVHDFIAAAC